MATVIVNGTVHESETGVLLSDIIAPEHRLSMPCGGKKKCGKCKVYAKGALSPLSEAEKRFLTETEIANGIRLACCTTVLGDSEISLADEGKGAIRTDGELPPIKLSPIFKAYGVAIDIGTTTLAARLYDVNGKKLADASELNPQSGYGADVISRIEASMNGASAELASVTLAALDRLIYEMSRDAGIGAEEIDGAVITGNTVMLHLLTETSTEPLSHAPFKAERLFGETLTAEKLGLRSVSADATVYLPRCAEAFVGADLTTALLASGIAESDETNLLVDIGTNGEMALVKGEKLLLCSTAAGPAFEGAGLSMGMGAKPGAIHKVKVVNGALYADILGNIEPKGICGSGVVDAVAALLDTEELDETGFIEDDEIVISAPVVLTQNDIRMVQLAKSAIHAGLRTLLHYAELDCSEVAALHVAGGFGSYLDIRNAGKIGLIPDELVPRVKILGNAALVGASMLLLSTDCRAKCEKTLSKAQVITLSSNPVFTEEYMERMMF
ncbi:MAG: DUF4445 domain-containing protein [Clostridia bacterium]|nr:DUF4445 domain-containing protein [Clostridia bacterium]